MTLRTCSKVERFARASATAILCQGAIVAVPACTSGNTGALDLFAPNGGATSPPAGTETTDARPSGSRNSAADARPSASGSEAKDALPPPPATGVPPPACADGGCVVPPTGCHTDGECGSDGTSRCEPISGTCVECLSASDCTSGDRPICSSVNHRCVECSSDSDCRDPSKPGCLLTTGRCEECSSDAHCPSGKTCDTSQGQCQ